MSAPVILSAEELAAIEARAKAATPGPWELQQSVTSGNGFFGLRDEIMSGNVTVVDGGGMTDEDATFIAHAREDIPALLAALAHMTKVAEAERARADVAERERDIATQALAAMRALIMEEP